MYGQIIGLDTETAGFGSAPVIEIGACKIVGEERTYYNAIIKYDPLTLPHFEKSRDIHGITPEMLLAGCDKKRAFGGLMDFIGGVPTLFVGHNLLMFDKPRINEGLLPCKFQLQDYNIADTMIVFQNELKYTDVPHWRGLKQVKQNGVKTNLLVAAKYYGIEVDETCLHRAHFDAELSLNIFLKQKTKHRWQ